MAWQDIADKHVTTPVILLAIEWYAAGTRYYSFDYVRTPTKIYKGNVLRLPQFRTSVGDIKRAFERNKLQIVFSDTDYEFRTLLATEAERIKNRTVTITLSFAEDDYATSLILFTGQIYAWQLLPDLQFKIDVEQKSLNMDNEYPETTVTRTDYPYADGTAIGLPIPIPYGTIDSAGAVGYGAFGHPSISQSTGLLFVDNRANQEKHLVGIQTAAITVLRVYVGTTLKTETTHYSVTTSVIAGKTHTLIEWVAGQNPTDQDLVTCDISYGSRRPVEAIRHFLENFCGYTSGMFDATTYAAAQATEIDRDYTFNGAIWDKKILRSHLDAWREELELDIYWDRDSKICFNYLRAYSAPSQNTYDDLNHIIGEIEIKPNFEKLTNKVTYGYEFYYSKAYFRNYETIEDTASQTKYGTTNHKYTMLYFVRTLSMGADLANRKLLRFKDPLSFLTVDLPLKTASDNLTDLIRITHFDGEGSGGYSRRLFQLRATETDPTDFLNTEYLEDISNFERLTCVLGDDTVQALTWATADEEDREYCYLCDDTTGQFSDGEPGKLLLD